MLAHFGGIAEDIAWPRNFDTFTNLRVSGVIYTTTRLVILGIAIGIGLLLWVWLKRTRTGMVIRAGVDDRAMVSAFGSRRGLPLVLWSFRTRPATVLFVRTDDRAMVSALGINIQLTFAIAFIVGSALAGLGGVIGGSFASLAPGVDANWLLYSLVVVIIGGMGSLGGAAIGALLLGFTSNFSAAYLPSNYTYYSIIFTFVLVAFVLAVRPLGLFGRRMQSRAITPDRVVAVVALVLAVAAPLYVSNYWVDSCSRRFSPGRAASMIFLSAYGGMVRLRRSRLRDRALAGQRDDERKHEGPQPGWSRWGIVVGVAIAVGTAPLFGGLANRSVGTTPHDHADVFGDRQPLFGQVTDVSFGGISGIPAPGAIGLVDAHQPPHYVALVVALGCMLLRYPCGRRSG
jgi:branched-subunit amino acid ABC-type transport system permease component